jgi:hypothetical protein
LKPAPQLSPMPDVTRAVAANHKERASAMKTFASPSFFRTFDLLLSTTNPGKHHPESLAPLWQGNCCPQCIGAESRGRLCRRHLEAAIRAKQSVSLDDDYRYLLSLLPHVENYARSFMWGYRDSDSPEDRAALLSAIDHAVGGVVVSGRRTGADCPESVPEVRKERDASNGRSKALPHRRLGARGLCLGARSSEWGLSSILHIQRQ